MERFHREQNTSQIWCLSSKEKTNVEKSSVESEGRFCYFATDDKGGLSSSEAVLYATFVRPEGAPRFWNPVGLGGLGSMSLARMLRGW
jgi:hypothetical protein